MKMPETTRARFALVWTLAALVVLLIGAALSAAIDRWGPLVASAVIVAGYGLVLTCANALWRAWNGRD